MSGKSVQAALESIGYRVSMLDPVNKPLTYLEELKKSNVVFIALHGKIGEDGVWQAFLEQNKIPFVGSGSKSSALCFDKLAYYNFLKNKNILMPKTELVSYDDYQISSLSSEPHVLKPNDGGSSIDTFIIRDLDNVDVAQLKTAFLKHKKLLLLNLIEGVELTVAVLGDQALPVIEIVPPANQEFDYKNKYNGATKEICPPVNISEVIQMKAKEIASKIHDLCGCKDMSRTDFILSEDQKIYVLETNTIPGLTDQSLLPKAAKQIGIDMGSVCDKLIKLAA
jgi:D-alanine-D-alanine ligase